MIGILLQDDENARGRFMAGLAGGDGGDANAHAIAIDGSGLPGEVHKQGDRAGGGEGGRPHPVSRLERLCLRGELSRCGDQRALRPGGDGQRRQQRSSSKKGGQAFHAGPLELLAGDSGQGFQVASRAPEKRGYGKAACGRGLGSVNLRCFFWHELAAH